MELHMFNLAESTTNYLESLREELEGRRKEIEFYFEEILGSYPAGYSNINSRVKSTSSLREKIFRNNYYKKYKSPEELLSNLSDLIGVRIECRFIEDENGIYRLLKEHFNKKHMDGFYYNSMNQNIRLDIESKQPQKQKNGLEIYRIDGIYEHDHQIINFELQIKSLVNVFWGEIEHKVIYKNNHYMLVNEFLRNTMLSIKENLLMIDHQLLAIDKHFNQLNAINPSVRKTQIETLLSKIIYDIYSTKMKNDIGFNIEFRESCDTIMKYIFRTNHAENLEDYNETLLKTLRRLTDISKNEITFNNEIKFERELCFEDEFCNSIGNIMLNSINNDFKWNLFFRILFEIERGNNAEDFENFVTFIKDRFYKNESFSKLHFVLNKEESKKIVDLLMQEIARAFKKIDSIKFIYDYRLEKIDNIIDNMVNFICKNISSYGEWEKGQDMYLEMFYSEIIGKI